MESYSWFQKAAKAKQHSERSESYKEAQRSDATAGAAKVKAKSQHRSQAVAETRTKACLLKKVHH